MDYLLALETSSARASLVLWGQAGLCLESEFAAGRGEPERLFAELEKALALIEPAAEVLPEVLLLVGLGPGSYTGVRKGIAAMQGLALARGWRILGLPLGASLPSLAGAGLLAEEGSGGWIAGDARRGEWFLQAYAGAELGELKLLSPEAFVEFVRALPAEEMVVATERFWAKGKPELQQELDEVVRVEQPQARVMAEMLWQGLSEGKEEEREQNLAWLAKLEGRALLPEYVRAPLITQPKKKGKLLNPS